jgi:hypothetical protein
MAQCRATAKGSGEPCRRQAIAGAAVCRVHGGAAPQVRRKAAERLAALVDPAIAVLTASMRQTKDKRLALSAAVDVLNRNSLTGKQKVEISGDLSIAEILRLRESVGP